MSYDWQALAPTRPLAISDIGVGALYVPRTGEGALEIDALLSAGLEQPIALFGPAGAGKSTELAALAKRRESKWVGPLVRLDKVLAYSDATSVEDVLDAIATFVIRVAIEKLGLKLSPELAATLGPAPPGLATHAGFDLVLAAVREIRSASKEGDVGLLVDGLEKASSGLARRTLANLERLRGEARVVVVVPTGLATGPSAAALQDYHVMLIGPVVVSETVDLLMSKGTEGDQFLFEIAARRLGVRPENIGRESWDTTAVAMRLCIVLSGGLIRTFLQLLQKAALYAAMRGRAAPDVQDVRRTAHDQTGFLLRLLKEGDVESLRAAHGTSGVEIEIDRRVRFLANGILLEYRTSAGPVVYVAPLLADAILKASPHG